MNKLYYILFLFFLSSCYSVVDTKHCINTDTFDIGINGNNLNKINQKLVLNKLINESSIKYNKDSDLLIEVFITLRRNTSLISVNNIVQLENLNFIVNYSIKNKIDNTIIDKGKFIIIDDLNISDNRFANYATDNYIMENFAKNLSIKLENRIKNLLIYKNCKKIQNQVAFYYFNININLTSIMGSYYA